MVEYPTDLDLDANKDVHTDAGNDLALTSGIEQLQQSIGIDVSDELESFVSGRLTGENVGQLEESIQSGLNEDPQLGEIQSVTLEKFDRGSSTVEIEVSVVQNEDFTLEVSR